MGGPANHCGDSRHDTARAVVTVAVTIEINPTMARRVIVRIYIQIFSILWGPVFKGTNRYSAMLRSLGACALCDQRIKLRQKYRSLGRC